MENWQIKRFLHHFDFETTEFLTYNKIEAENDLRSLEMLSTAFIFCRKFNETILLLEQKTPLFHMEFAKQETKRSLCKIRYNLAFCYFKTGKPQRTFSTYESELLFPSIRSTLDEFDFCLLGRANKLLDNFETAIARFQQALALNPFMFSAMSELTKLNAKIKAPLFNKDTYLGFVFTVLELFDNKAFAACIELGAKAEDQNLYVLATCGKALYSVGKFLEAKNVFLALQKSHPFSEEGTEEFSSVLWQLNDVQSLRDLTGFLTETRPENSCCWTAAGNLFSLQREAAKSKAMFRRAIWCGSYKNNYRHRRTSYAQTLLANEHFIAQENAEAENNFRKALQTNMKDYAAWFGLAMVASAKTNFEEATEYIQEANRLNKENSTIWAHLGRIMAKCNRKSEATQSLEKALAVNESNALAYLELAKLHKENKEYEKAVSLLKVACSKFAGEGEVYLLMGICYQHLGNKLEALNFYSLAVKFYNNDIRLISKIRRLTENL